MSEPRDAPKPSERTPKWSRTIETWIVFFVTALFVLALAFVLLGERRDSTIAVCGALAAAGLAGVAAARSPPVRTGIIGVLSFLQNFSQLWR